MANFADNYLKKKKEKEKKKFSVSVTLGDKKVSVAAPGQTVKQQTQKVQQTARQNAAAQRQQQAQKRVQAYQAQRASTSGKTAGSKNGTASQNSRTVSQPAAPEKKPFALPTLPGAQMARERILSPFSPMERNSSSWAYLQNAKTLARQTKKPQSYMDSLTQRQNALHQANVELAKRLPLRYNAQTGSWENTQGGQAYAARVLPGVTAQTSIANSVPAQMARNQAAQMRQNGQTMLPKPAAEQLKDAGKELGGIAKDFGSAAVNAAKNAAFLAANSARGGLHQFNEGIYSTLDFFVPDFVPVVSDAIKYGKENAQKGAEKVRQENYARGTAAGIAGDVGAGLVSSLPSALAALASGGGSLAAELGSRSGAVVTAAKQVLKNPATWINAMQTYGPEYEKAKQGGASDAQAAANALISTLLQSGIEVSGGMETLGKTAKGAGRYIKSALEEGAEEVAQDIASRSVAALTYDKPQTLEDIYSKENPEALINPVRMAQQGAMGAAVGGLYSGAHALGSRIGQHVSSTETKNKSTDQILDNRLQLPELLSDDTLVAYSIAQNTAGDKGLPLPDPGTLRQGIWMPGETKPRLKPEYESWPESRMRAPEEETMLQNQLAEVEKMDGFDLPEVQAHTTINTDPGTHTPEQMAQIQEYVDAVDDGLLDFAERYAEDPNAQFGRYTISKVSQRQADEISGILGIDVSGYQNAINKSGVNHILKRHGANGEADQSMAELSDISRMGYVLDNYDSVQPLTNEKGEFVTSTEFRGKDNAPAPMVRFAKKIDGTYYVVEAVADNRYKKLWVVSAYMEKSSPITQVLDAEKTAPSSQSSETPLASLESALAQSIPYQTMENKPADSRMRTPEEEAVLQAQLAAVEEIHTPQAGQADAGKQDKTLNDRIRENREKFAEQGVLAELSGNEFQKGEKKLIDQVTDFFKSLGNKVVRKGFGEVTLTRSGARDSISHGTGREKSAAFAAVPDIIQKGQIIDEQANWKGRRYDTVTFGGRIRIDGKDYDMGVIVKRYDNPGMASKYYLHEVLLTKEEGEATTFKTGTRMGYPSDVTSPSETSIPYQTAENKPADSGHIQAQEAHDGESGALLAAWDDARKIRRRIEQAEQRMKLTDRDRAFVESALQTGSTTNFYEADNPQDVQYLFELRAAERDAMAPVWEYNARQQEGMQREAAEDADTIAEFATDKKRGLYYLTETPERNLYDIFGKGNRDKAESFIRRYITPVHQAVAEGNRLANDMRSRVKALGLDKDESAVVQYLLENQAGGAEQYIREHKMKMPPQRQAKIDKAVAEFRDIYNELHRRIVETQIRNGYEPTEYRKNYAPHFVEKQEDKLLARVLYKFGMKITKKDQLPTDLAGVTETFRPGRRWFGNLERRKGNETIYDAVRGFDQYIESAADSITLIDSIGRIRALEDAVRYRLSDEGTQAKIDAIRADRSLDGLKKRQAMEKAYEDEPGKLAKVMRDLNEQKEMGMRNFVTELRRYGDSLAGKKSRGDRGIEDAIGRDIYEVSRAVEGRVAANMIGANPGSWLTNFIPLTQALGEVDTASMLKGLYQTVKAYAKDDGFVDASAFLTNRRGSDRLVKDTAQKVGDALGKPMEWFDQFTADAIVRARTAQNMNQKGMSLEAAIDEADAFAGSLMGDRSKGSMPGVFEMRNPVTKVFTMYQLEVNNQLRYMFKDLPRRLGEEGAAAVALGLTKMFTAAYVYNAIYRELTGRDAALDPIRMIQDALGGIGDEEDERTAAERAKELGMDAAEQLPFIGGLLGGGRVPVSAALPNPMNLGIAIGGTSKAPEKRWDMAKKELLKPAAYILPPFGGGAVKRAVEGYQTVSQGGAYSLNNEGERELMFPQYGQGPADYARAMLFGRWSTDQAQQYVESGFKRLNAEDTATYEWMTKERGIDPQKAYAVIQQVNGTKAPKDGSQSRKQAQREAIMALDLGWEDKVELDRRMIGGDDLISYTDAESFRVTNELPEREQAAAMRLMNDYGLSVDQAQKYAGIYGDFKTYTLNQNKTARWNYEDGSYRDMPMYTEDSKKVRLQKMRDAIEADSSLDDAQKEGILRTAILPELGDKYVSSYADDYIGGIDVGTLLDSQAAYERISEEVKKDMSIHEKNRSEYTRLRFDDYLESTGLSRAQQDKIWYFQSRGEDDLKMGWADLVRTGGEDIQKVGGQLEASGMDVTTYKVIKAGMDRIYSDKDANGNTIADSKKPKIIAYLNEYPELTNEQKNLLMIADGYKYGMGEKPKKSSSKKSSSGSSSKKSNPFSMKTAPKIKGLPLP